MLSETWKVSGRKYRCDTKTCFVVGWIKVCHDNRVLWHYACGDLQENAAWIFIFRHLCTVLCLLERETGTRQLEKNYESKQKIKVHTQSGSFHCVKCGLCIVVGLRFLFYSFLWQVGYDYKFCLWGCVCFHSGFTSAFGTWLIPSNRDGTVFYLLLFQHTQCILAWDILTCVLTWYWTTPVHTWPSGNPSQTCIHFRHKEKHKFRCKVFFLNLIQ